jgi:hypothetical protein
MEINQSLLGRADEDLWASDALLKDIGALVASGAKADTIAKALDRPATEVSATLRRQRRRIALLLTAAGGAHLYDSTIRYYGILGRVLTELEKRTETDQIESVSMTSLIALSSVITKWLKPINEALSRDPGEMDAKDKAGSVNYTFVHAIIQEAQKVRSSEERERELRRMRLTQSGSDPMRPLELRPPIREIEPEPADPPADSRA